MKLWSLKVHPKYHGGPRYASGLIFLKVSNADLKFAKKNVKLLPETQMSELVVK